MAHAMERDWSRLPEQFAYVRPMADEYDRWLQEHRYNDRAAMESLTPRHIAGLARVYEQIDSRGDAEPLSVWLDAIPR